MSEVNAAEGAHNTCILPCNHAMNKHKSSNRRGSQSKRMSHAGMGDLEGCELVEVGSKEGGAADRLHEVL